MAISFACRGCGQHYRVEDALAGKPTECRACRERTIVPAARPKPALQSFGTAAPAPRPSSRPTPTRDLPADAIYSADELEFQDDEPAVKAQPRRPKAVASGYDVDPTLANPGRAGYVARDEGPTHVPSGMTRRCIAYLIDRVLIFALALIVIVMSGILSNPDRARALLVMSLIEIAVWVVYLCVFPATPLGGTPGKAICGLRVVTYEGDRINLGTAIYRGLLVFIAEVWLIPFMWNVRAVLDDPEEMTLYDCRCRTRVIRSRQEAIQNVLLSPVRG